MVIGPSHVSGVGQRATRGIDVYIDGHTVEGPVSMAAEARTCSRTTTGRGQDSPASTALDVPTALMSSSSGASTTPTAPDEHGAQTSRAQRGALAPGTIMGRTGYETTRPRARAFENYHGPSSSARHSARRPWEGGRRMDGSRRSGGRALMTSVIMRTGKGLRYSAGGCHRCETTHRT